MRTGSTRQYSRDRRLAIIAGVAGLFLLLVVSAVNVSFGASSLTVVDALQLLLVRDGSPESVLVWDVRLPRVMLAIMVGINLAIAGVLIQTLTRNPLASPQTFGISAGASLAIVICLIAFPQLGRSNTIWPAFAGAALVGCLMWILSASGRMTTMKLALAGISIQLVLSALVQAILIANNAAQDIVYWLAGSLTGAQWNKVMVILPFTMLGGGLALLARRYLSVLALDEATRISLGMNASQVGGFAAFLVVVLAGSAVAVSGPIGFIGLLVPHMARRLAGGDYGHILLLSAVFGPLLLSSADITGRLLAFPSEMPAGVVTALIGAPVFFLILWQQKIR